MKLTAQEKARESRVRYLAAKQRCLLVKSRTRNPRIWDYGLWWLVAPESAGGIVYGSDSRKVGDPPGMTLDEVESQLNSSFWTPRR
jgi:hypothetical protein